MFVTPGGVEVRRSPQKGRSVSARPTRLLHRAVTGGLLRHLLQVVKRPLAMQRRLLPVCLVGIRASKIDVRPCQGRGIDVAIVKLTVQAGQSDQLSPHLELLINAPPLQEARPRGQPLDK